MKKFLIISLVIIAVLGVCMLASFIDFWPWIVFPKRIFLMK